ncbi:hypothetical protein [Christiangramia salexigens]|nr:hypothetical protein [Christiangramia salexigens]
MKKKLPALSPAMRSFLQLKVGRKMEANPEFAERVLNMVKRKKENGSK